MEKLNTLSHVYAVLTEFVVKYALQVLGAVVILLVGLMVAGMVQRALLRTQARRQMDLTLSQFIASTGKLVVLTLFALIALSNVGISIAPMLAAVGGMAVGAGFALQGLVSNYGAGLSIILGRTFRIGDTIKVVECSGVVEEITLPTTRLRNDDGESIVIPNRKIVGEVHSNSYRHRVVAGSVGVPYGCDPQRAVALICGVLDAQLEAVNEHPPQVGIESFGAETILIAYRYWAPSVGYFKICHAVNGAIYVTLTEAGIDLRPNGRRAGDDPLQSA